MGSALVGGLLASGWAPEDIVVVDKLAPARASISSRHRGVTVAEGVVAGDAAVLAVKPADAEEACRALREVGVGRVLSIAAGVTLGALESWLGPRTEVVRAMPNTPALVGEGASALAGGSLASEEVLSWAEAILGAVGVVSRVPESQLDAVTGLSGSGPAYLFLVAEALIEAGVAAGLPAAVSRSLCLQTLLGSARLLAESGDDPAALRAQVTSPGGTTEAGVAVLEARGVRQALVDAVVAATERSRQLGRGS
jgi:pyrroline-5-carboxylate reductase